MTVERNSDGFTAICDSCGVQVCVCASTPRSAKSVLRQIGWQRFDYIPNIRLSAYMWQCPVCKENP